VRAASNDPVRTLYRALLVLATVGIVILAVGLVEFIYFEPLGQTTGAKAHIVGVFQFDPTTQKTFGTDQSSYKRSQIFAAVVDWSSLPKDITVDARWYDSYEVVVGHVGPGSPAQLADKTAVSVAIPAGLRYNLPGQYIFVVERLSGGIPVEVLARRIVLVERT
jgi:hypothetical protein